MNARERRLVVVLALFLVFGAAFAAYALVVAPIQDLKAEADKVEMDVSIKQAVLTKLNKDRVRADAAKKRSLPADPDVARVEYDAMMRKLLTEANVPAGFTITPRESLDTKSIPVFDPRSKKPVYSKLGFEIRMKKVDLATVTRFLHAYYRLNLLHQITFLNITRKDQEPGSRARAGGDRADLDVQILTEAIVLDGAENRQTLLPMPLGAAMVGGNAGHHALLNSRDAGRHVSPLQLAPVLAAAKPPRDYSMISAKDFIHGPLPPPPAPRVAQAAPPAPPKPKEDISPFIKLTGITRRSDGTAEATVWDQVNNQDYQIDLRPKGERYEVRVQKFYRISPTRKGKYYTDTRLTIAEDDTATNRTFTVVGLDGNGLVLTEATTLAAEPAKADGGRPRPGGKPAAAKLPTPPPAAAVTGGPGVAFAPAGEKVFVWRTGQTLGDLAEVSGKEAEEVLRRAAPVFPSAVTETPPPATSPVSKSN